MPAESPGLINYSLSVVFSSQNGIFIYKLINQLTIQISTIETAEMLCFPFHYRKKMSAQGSRFSKMFTVSLGLCFSEARLLLLLIVFSGEEYNVPVQSVTRP